MRFSPILALHVTAGMIGMASGAAALIFRKGSPRHALAGKVFVASMLTMAAGAVYLAVLKNQPDNVGGGILTLYLITTAWLTAKRRDGETRIFDWALLLIPLWAGVLSWIHGLQVVRNHTVAQQGALPVFMGFFMGSMMLVAAAECYWATGFSALNVSCGIFGACASACSSPRAHFSSDRAAKSSAHSGANLPCSSSPQFCLCSCWFFGSSASV
jgi:uncharacterized membrane protein